MRALPALLALLPLVAAADPPGRDPRSTVLLSRDCATELGHREVTLFANGTVRLRHGPQGGETLRLAELGPEELLSLERELARLDLSEAEESTTGPRGEWVEECTLELALPGTEVRRFRFGAMDSLSLPLGRLQQVVGELAVRAELGLGASEMALALDYDPRPGDVLVHRDGERYEVVGLTRDGSGVELRGVTSPLTLYVPRDRLSRLFIARESGED